MWSLLLNQNVTSGLLFDGLGVQAAVRQLHFPPLLATKLAEEDVLKGHMGCVNRLAWNSDGSRIASGSDDRKVSVRPFFGNSQSSLMAYVRYPIARDRNELNKRYRLKHQLAASGDALELPGYCGNPIGPQHSARRKHLRGALLAVYR